MIKFRTVISLVITALLLFGTICLDQASAATEAEWIAGSGKGYVDGSADKAKFYQPSLVTCVGDDIYVLDGVSIRKVSAGQVQTVTSLWEATDELSEYGLDGEARIWSFRSGNMLEKDGKLYLSGLMFKKDVKGPLDLTPYSYNWTREGFTYNVFFEIDLAEKTIDLLHADVAYCNIVPRSGNYISGLWDRRPDLIYHEGKWLYGYYFFVPVPQIQPYEDGFLVMKSEDRGQEINATSYWLAKWSTDGHEEKLFNLTKLPHRYYEWDPVPHPKGSAPFGLVGANALPLDNDRIFLIDGVNTALLNIYTGQVEDWNVIKTMPSSDKPVHQRGRKIGDSFYFLDNGGIWTIRPDGRALRILNTKYLHYSGGILGYDIKGDDLIVANATRGTIDKIDLSTARQDHAGMIYLNGKPVMAAKNYVERYYEYGRFTQDAVIHMSVIRKVLNLNAELSPWPNWGVAIYHPSGRSTIIPIVPGYGERSVLLSDLIEAYNSISVLKLEGKYTDGSLYLKTTGTIDSQEQNDAPPVMYGLPLYE